MGRQKLKWLDNVEVDLKTPAVRRWRTKALDFTKMAKGCDPKKKKKMKKKKKKKMMNV